MIHKAKINRHSSRFVNQFVLLAFSIVLIIALFSLQRKKTLNSSLGGDDNHNNKMMEPSILKQQQTSIKLSNHYCDSYSSNKNGVDYHQHCSQRFLRKINISDIEDLQKRAYEPMETIKECTDLLFNYPCHPTVNNNHAYGKLWWNHWDGFKVFIEDVNIILEIGTNVGDALEVLLRRYPKAVIHSFEAIPSIFVKAQARYVNNPRVHLYPYGLLDKYIPTPMEEDNGATTIKTKENQVTGKHNTTLALLADAADFFQMIKPDMVYMNCEGCEYKVIPRLSETQLLSKIKMIFTGTHRIKWAGDILCTWCEKTKTMLENNFKLLKGKPFGWEVWQNTLL